MVCVCMMHVYDVSFVGMYMCMMYVHYLCLCMYVHDMCVCALCVCV